MTRDDTVVIDVRNFNETIIGKFAPSMVLSGATSGASAGDGNSAQQQSAKKGATVLDPCMRRSTEFPQWAKDHLLDLKGKQVQFLYMYNTIILITPCVIQL